MPPSSRQAADPKVTPDITNDPPADTTPSADPPADTVRLAVGYPHDALVIDKDLTITADGTDVPLDREDEVRDAAQANDVPIRKVK